MPVPAESHLPQAAPLPDDSRLVALVRPESMAAEQYRVLLTRLDRMKAARPMRIVAVTSCARGEGRSMTAANLALTASREGREVALVECDLRRPSLAGLFDLQPPGGLAEVVEGTVELAQALVRVDGIMLLCAGEARDPPALLRNPRLAMTLDTLRASFPLVVLDAPPALALSDAARLEATVDGMLLVVKAGETPRDVVRLAVEVLGDRLLGIVLNGVEEPGYARYLRHEAAAP
jgi:capsular exopolysaccharide synthesis family protein